MGQPRYRYQRWSVATIAAAASVVTSVSTWAITAGKVRAAAQARADAHITELARSVVEPLRNDLRIHVDRADAAMAPGGAMHDRFTTMERRVNWLVQERVCRIDRASRCPSLSEVVQR